MQRYFIEGPSGQADQGTPIKQVHWLISVSVIDLYYGQFV